MRKALVLLLAISLIAVVAAAITGQFLLVSQHIAYVGSHGGEVLVKLPRASQFAPLAEASHVLAGTVLRTGADGFATLNWVDGTRLHVEPNSIITVLRCQINRSGEEQISQFRLDRGEILVRLRKLLTGQSKFEINTPTATAGVRGTVFRVTVDPAGRTEVTVFEGQVALTTATGHEVLTPGGQGIATVQGLEVVSAASPAESPELPEPLLGPTLILFQPIVGQPILPGRLTVTGHVEKNATVTINGQSVPVNKLQRFVTTVQVPAGQDHFTLTLVARDTEGRTTEAVRRLMVAPAPAPAP